MSNQYVVPIVENAAVTGLVVLSLCGEVGAGETDLVYDNEPKLRDALLQRMFDHANLGGFSGSFTQGNVLGALKVSLLETARRALGESISDVLIVDIVRQDV